MKFFGNIFEKRPTEEDRETTLRNEYADLDQRRKQMEYFMENREGESYLVAPNDAEKLNGIKQQMEEIKRALGEFSAPESDKDPKEEKAV